MLPDREKIIEDKNEILEVKRGYCPKCKKHTVEKSLPFGISHTPFNRADQSWNALTCSRCALCGAFMR